MSEYQNDDRAAHRAPRRSRRLRFAPVAVLAGVAATAALALSMNGTLSAFTAQITNSANSAGNGTLIMTETQTVGQSTTTCNSTDSGSVATNSATCTTINKFGGVTNLVPGGTSSASVTISNTGTATAGTFTLTPGTCTQGGSGGTATDLCSKMTIKVDKVVGGTTTNVIPAGTTLAAANTAGAVQLGAVAPAGSVQFNFTVTLPAGLTNVYQGLNVSQPLVWLFSAGS
jgi:hypothetical protein